MIKEKPRALGTLVVATATLIYALSSPAQAAVTTPAGSIHTQAQVESQRRAPSQAWSQDPATHRRLYVGGLSYSVDDDGLRELFTPFGTINFVKVIRDFHSGRSKGFGFVEMSTPEEAREAIEALNGSIHERRTITVSEANPPDSSATNTGHDTSSESSTLNHPTKS